MSQEIEEIGKRPEQESQEMAFTSEDLAELHSKLETDRLTTPDRTKIDGGEIVRFTPEFVRKDEVTGEEVIPLLFIRGMGASEADEWYLEQLAQIDQRPVIGVTYQGRLGGSTDPAEVEGLEGTVSEIDVKEAEDITKALETLGIARVDLIAESRGALAGVLFMRDHPDAVRDAVLEHPAGQNRRGFRQRHIDAARERIARAVRGRKQGRQNELPEGVTPIRQESRLDVIKNARAEHKSVATGQLDVELGKLSPGIHIVMTGDRDDKAFRAADLEETARRAREAGASVEFEETNWGGHGIRYDKDALGESVYRLRRMERKRSVDE